MIAYATLSTGRSTERMYAAGWGVFLTPEAYAKNRPQFISCLSWEPPMPYAIDNGAWSAYLREEPWDERPWKALLVDFGGNADFVVVPDIVAGGLESLGRSKSYLPLVHEHSELALIPVQDGMQESDLRPLIGPRVGIFVGGTTEFKEKTLAQWSALCREVGAWCHVGRVNSVRRTFLCSNAQVDSIDGTSVVRFSKTLGKLDAARRQMTMMGEMDV